MIIGVDAEDDGVVDADDVDMDVDEPGVDGDFNLSIVNLLPFHDSTAFSKPFGSRNDRGVVCSEVAARNCNAIGLTMVAGELIDFA